MGITNGTMLHYRLDANDVERVNKVHMYNPQRCNKATLRETVPAMVILPWGPDCANIQVFVDGDFTIWRTSASRGSMPGEWSEMEEQVAPNFGAQMIPNSAEAAQTETFDASGEMEN